MLVVPCLRLFATFGLRYHRGLLSSLGKLALLSLALVLLAVLILSVPLGEFGSFRIICVAATDGARSRPSLRRADFLPAVDTRRYQ